MGTWWAQGACGCVWSADVKQQPHRTTAQTLIASCVTLCPMPCALNPCPLLHPPAPLNNQNKTKTLHRAVLQKTPTPHRAVPRPSSDLKTLSQQIGAERELFRVRLYELFEPLASMLGKHCAAFLAYQPGWDSHAAFARASAQASALGGVWGVLRGVPGRRARGRGEGVSQCGQGLARVWLFWAIGRRLECTRNLLRWAHGGQLEGWRGGGTGCKAMVEAGRAVSTRAVLAVVWWLVAREGGAVGEGASCVWQRAGKRAV